MHRSKKAAHEAGIAAGKELTSLTSNPFEQNSPEWQDWRSGWKTGADSLGMSHGYPSIGGSPRPPNLDEIELDLYHQELDFVRSTSRRKRKDVPDLCDLLEGYDEW